MKRVRSESVFMALSGVSLGGLGAALAVWGNPANSGICISCFLENLAGSLGLHGNVRMAYLRPELAGIVAGSMITALIGRELRPRVGKLPVLGFMMGFFLIAGCSVFMGCPIKMMLRLGAGDMTATAGFAGLITGVWVGTSYYRAGLDMGGASTGAGGIQGIIVPLIIIAAFVLSVLEPDLFVSNVTGPGARRAPVIVAMLSGILIGALAQRSRFCVTGSFTNLFLAGDAGLMRGIAALMATALVVNASVGLFRLGMLDQPGSHPDHIWNFMSMALVGFASVLAGGCPFRHLILTGEGMVDSAVVILGMLAGGGIVHQWGIAGTSAGPTSSGKIAVLVGLAFCFTVARTYRRGSGSL